ncbi:calcium/sodium antiporter [Glycocaulis abyssi]|uniref:Calcium/sodium antiporter n=1 Tax=Glycocaulis abyssi TaxID=1433403 RepID=A0ABV9NAZ8_9PROT
MSATLLDVLLLIVGIIIILFGGDYLVRGATAVAKRTGVPSLLIGLTIVAFGTSAPEMVVSVFAAIAGSPGLAVGNIVGSNIANIFLVLGLPALIAVMGTTAKGVRTNALIALAASLLFIALCWDWEANAPGTLSLLEGALLTGLIIAYIVYLGFVAMGSRDDPMVAELTGVDSMEGLPKSALGIGFSLIVGLVALPIGANLIVEGGASLALTLGVSEAVIGLTLLAIGTSLPELATSVVAAVRRQADMAIGNVIGSNIFNIFAVGGITGLAAGGFAGGVSIDPGFFQLDLWVFLASAVFVTVLVFSRRPMGRTTGAALLLIYAAYIAALLYFTLG